MVESAEFKLPTGVDQVVASENVFANQQSEFYKTNLLMTSVLQLDNWELKLHQLTEDIKCCETMSERLSLFINKDNIIYVKSLDLAITEKPKCFGELERLNEEYEQLIKCLIEQNLIAGEIPRDESGRTIQFRPPHDELADSKWCVGIRTRPLINFEIAGNFVSIEKRMVFAMPQHNASQFTDQHGSVSQLEHMDIIENMIRDHDELIVPIRTVYYAAKKTIEVDDILDI